MIKWHNLRLLTKLMLMIISTVAITVGCLYLMTRHLNKDAIIETESSYLLNMGEDLADEPEIITALENNQTSQTLTDFTHAYEDQYNLDYVVVINTDSIRLSHPDPDLINQPFAGGDEENVFTGQPYVSTGIGTLGNSLRSFAPVIQDDQVIGAVVVGKTNHAIDVFSEKYDQQTTSALIVSIAIGVTVAIFVSYTIKKELFNMEPKEIAKAFEERSAMIAYSHDAIIVTNQYGEITLANKEALRHFPIPDKENKTQLDNVISLPEMNGDHSAVFHYQDKEYLISQADILVQENLVGQIYIIRDTSEIYALLDQLHSTAEYAQLLQVQAHEFLNRLHVIYGLTDLEEYDALDQYLASLIKDEEDLTIRLSMLVKNPTIAGHLIGEHRILNQSLKDLRLEIHHEIPNTYKAATNQLWMETVAVIDKELRQLGQNSRLWLSLDFDTHRCQLITNYRLQGNVDHLYTWLSDYPWQTETVTTELSMHDQQLNFSFRIDYSQGDAHEL